jgi:hypothetical protein
MKAVNRVKYCSIILLELTSGITTAIGMAIVASDISPLIAIIWAVVIQGLAGMLSSMRGKWNALILTACLTFSIGSDYVCYVNAVMPYDAYLEEQYSNFKASYDPAWERAMQLVNDFESTDENIDVVFDNIDNALLSLSSQYNDSILAKEQDKLDTLGAELEKLDPTIKYSSGESNGTIVTYDNEGNPHYNYTHSQTQGVTDNPEYINKYAEWKKQNDKVINVTENIAKILTIVEQYKQLDLSKSEDYAVKVKERAKQLFSDLLEEDTTSESYKAMKSNLESFAGTFKNLQKSVNNLLVENGMNTFDILDLSAVQSGNASYITLKALQLPDFDSVRKRIKEGSSIFDKFFEGAATVIDSEFAIDSTHLKKLAANNTEQYYNDFKEAIAGLNDTQLNKLVSSTNKDDDVVSLDEAKVITNYRDALSLAFSYLRVTDGKALETYSRVLYACLADGLVLLIGFSLKRKKTSIYRVKNRRDLTNEEPRLISEALYNLSARPLDNDPKTKYKVQTLLHYLGDFMSCFTPEPYMQDLNLDMSFSLVCKDLTMKRKLETDYRDLTCLLQTLRYIKPISKEQYEFFTQYKRNKAALDIDAIHSLTGLEGKCSEHYFLMTEGCQLYLTEKINDLYSHIEDDEARDEIKRTFLGTQSQSQAPQTDNSENGGDDA